MDATTLGIFIAVVALVFTVVNCAVALFDVFLSRIRLLTIRNITYERCGRPDWPTESRHFMVDLWNVGAPVWDIEVDLVIDIPYTRANVVRGHFGKIVLGLSPVGEYITPLNPGQGLTFELWEHLHLTPDLRAKILDVIPHVPRRNISLCVYCSRRRKLLRRINGSTLQSLHVFHWKLDQFLDGALNVKLLKYQEKYLSWKDRHVFQSEGKSLCETRRGWVPPWKRDLRRMTPPTAQVHQRPQPLDAIQA